MEHHGVPLKFDEMCTDLQPQLEESKLPGDIDLEGELEATAAIPDPLRRELAISQLSGFFRGKLKKSTLTAQVEKRLALMKRASDEAVEQAHNMNSGLCP